jgi:glycosidase
MLTLRGTPFLYNGEEIGMTDLLLEDTRQLRNIMATFMYQTATMQMGVPQDEAMKQAAKNSRDCCRTPMLWANRPNAGFIPAGVKT